VAEAVLPLARVTLEGVTLAEGPFLETAVDMETVPENPAILLRVIALVAVELAGMFRYVGFAVTVRLVNMVMLPRKVDHPLGVGSYSPPTQTWVALDGSIEALK
jgi:hypothetical protein